MAEDQEPDTLKNDILFTNEHVGENGGGHGALVENMLKVRESAENKTGTTDPENAQKYELNSQQKKEVERSRQELIKTQETIQELSRAIVPLAKAADFAQEDSDQMAKEHGQWRTWQGFDIFFTAMILFAFYL